MNNLWGSFKKEDFLMPNKILEKQAEYLPNLTDDYVYAFVERNTKKEDVINKKSTFEDINSFNRESIKFVYDFYIKGKYLKNYSYLLLEIRHELGPYPLDVELDGSMIEEISIKLGQINPGWVFLGQKRILSIDNEEEFIKVLEVILTSKRTKSVISAIINLSN
ncbi:hypothetical protein IAI10_02120 [Clostridium sp. 19966]|uniref:hypothetical protein n=1 Tax=Clostridium sp. 19966 TaxID=2768166 RepID=UPI0028E09274|nr:hypothetical protein [Clostridium sp. 19966]MDT8715453.1 hypothetical protein [Clostridium sp. 19966]